LLLRTLARQPSRIRPGLALAGLTNAGTVDTAPIRSGFDRLVGPDWPAGTWICAVDLDTGDRTAFGAPGAPTTDPGLAVAASCAVPSYFAPVEIDGRRYVDGGVVSPVNSDLVGGQPGLSAVVVSVPMGRHGPPGRRGIDLPGRSLNHAQAMRGLASVRAAGVPVMVVEPTARELEVMHYDAFEQSHLSEIAARVRATLGRRLDTGPGSAGRHSVLEVLRQAKPWVQAGVEGALPSSEATGTGGGGPT
jgi:NTE family protein